MDEGNVPPSRSLAHPETIIQSALAQKTLQGWMQNRYQTRYPLVLNLGNLPPAHATLLLEAVSRSLRLIDADEQSMQRANAFIERIGGSLDAARPIEAIDVVAKLRAARLLPQAYAACAGAIGRGTTANRRFLDFLAARFDLPDDMARSINRRFAH